MKKHDEKKRIVSIDVTQASYSYFISQIINLGRNLNSSYVCVANVHMVVEAYKNPEYASFINSADLVTPDGMPLVKALKLSYGLSQERVAGMDLFPDLLSEAEKQGQSIFLYGSTENVLQNISRRISSEHPTLKIAGIYSPPFRPLTDSESSEIVTLINSSGANLVFVSLGCPKQEIWMANHKGKINAVMIGVGGAFPVYSGLQKRAPVWMQKSSLEWFYRLCQEPRRLIKRYLITNTMFIFLILKQLITQKTP